jgi:hypothetical protein
MRKNRPLTLFIGIPWSKYAIIVVCSEILRNTVKSWETLLF